MRRNHIEPVLALIVLLPGTVAHAQPPKASTAAERFCKRLGKAKTIAFTMQDFIALSFTTHTYSRTLNPGQRFEVKAMRPNFLSEVGTPAWTGEETDKNGQKLRRFVGFLMNIDRSNSQGRIQIGTLMHRYKVGPARKTLQQVPEGEDDPIEAWLIFRKNPLDGFKRATDETLHGAAVTVFLGSEHGAKQKLYFDKGSGELLQFSRVGVQKDGTELEWSRKEYSDWQLAVDFPPSTFETTPPAGYKLLLPYKQPPKP